MSRNQILGASAVAFAVVIVTALQLFGIISLPFLQPSTAQLLGQINEASMRGGYSVSFSQPDIAKWRIADGHQLERFSLEGGEPAFARLSSRVPLDAKTWEWSTQGLSVTFPVEFNNRTNGQKIEVGVVARSAVANPSNAVSVVYATQQAGNSGWRDLKLTSDFSLQTFVFDVPKIKLGGYDKQPIIVVNSDRKGSGNSIEILGVYVKPVENQ